MQQTAIFAAFLLCVPTLVFAEEVFLPHYAWEESPGAKAAGDRRTLLVGSVSAGIAGTMLTIGTLAWWRDKGYAGFSLNDTGFFGRHTYAGGSDKAGHIYACYVTGKGMRQIYQWLGVPRVPAVALSAGFTFLISSTVELVDGFTPFGFEWTDVVANVAGLSFFLAGEIYRPVDDLFGLRIGWIPTPEFIDRQKNYIKLVNDYGGMIFYLDFKPAGLQKAFRFSPGFFRYLLFSLAYGTNGYSPGGPDQRRNIGFFVGLNLPEILNRLFGGQGRAVRAASTFTRYYALPFTGIGFNQDLNQNIGRINFGAANRLEVE